MSLEIASVGWKIGHESIKRIKFCGGESVSTFDVVLVNPKSISLSWEKIFPLNSVGEHEIKYSWASYRDQKIFNKIKSEIQRRKEEFEELLKSGGCIITKLIETPKFKKIENGKAKATYHGFSFLPEWNYPPMAGWEMFPKKIIYNLRDRRFREGENIDISKEHPFSNYLEFVNSTNKEVQLNYSRVIEPSKDGWMEHIDVIAKNYIGNIISAEFPVFSGKVVFLPNCEVSNPEAENGVLLSSLQGLLSTWSPKNIPEWTSGFTVPEENCNQPKIDELDKKINVLESEKEELKEEQEYYKKFKKLLYGKGKFVLEPVVREALDLFDFEVSKEFPGNAIRHEIDGLLKHDDSEKSVIVEIEGRSNSWINVQKFNQLDTRVKTALIEFDEEFTGLLIGNGHASVDPGKREAQFTKDVIKLCEHRNFACLTTYQIYLLVKKTFEDDNDDLKRQVRDRIVNGSGLITFEDLIE